VMKFSVLLAGSFAGVVALTSVASAQPPETKAQVEADRKVVGDERLLDRAKQSHNAGAVATDEAALRKAHDSDYRADHPDTRVPTQAEKTEAERKVSGARLRYDKAVKSGNQAEIARDKSALADAFHDLSHINKALAAHH
ncbi:MAG: hypothetical protein ACRYG4_25325, partial [Janthinobacterium lividum]